MLLRLMTSLYDGYLVPFEGLILDISRGCVHRYDPPYDIVASTRVTTTLAMAVFMLFMSTGFSRLLLLIDRTVSVE